MEIIHRYTRAQALADGVLLSATDMGRDCGFRAPLAITAAVWEHCVAWRPDPNVSGVAPQDETGRLCDVVWCARMAANRARDTARVAYTLNCVPPNGANAEPVTLTIVAGPGDDGELVLTIMFPNED